MQLVNYALVFPSALVTRVEDDGTTLVIEVPCEGGEVLCGEYDCPVADSPTILEQTLRTEAQRFFECISRVASVKIVGHNLEAGDLPPLLYVSLVVSLEGGQIWVAWLYGQLGVASYVLVHWNGASDRVIPDILPLLSGVRPGGG
jgi:hypothetical protein